MEHFNTSLSWSVPPDSGFAEVIGFNVYRRRTGTGGYEKQTPVPITSTTYEESVANLVMYDYAVTAIDSFGRESAKVEVTGQVAGKRGDLNNDGDIDITDVLVCINVIRNPDYFSPAQKAMSDFNRDGAINDADVKALRMAILGQ